MQKIKDTFLWKGMEYWPLWFRIPVVAIFYIPYVLLVLFYYLPAFRFFIYVLIAWLTGNIINGKPEALSAIWNGIKTGGIIGLFGGIILSGPPAWIYEVTYKGNKEVSRTWVGDSTGKMFETTLLLAAVGALIGGFVGLLGAGIIIWKGVWITIGVSAADLLLVWIIKNRKEILSFLCN